MQDVETDYHPGEVQKGKKAERGTGRRPPVIRRRLSPEAQARLEADAMTIPTNAEEYRRVERAAAALKAVRPAYWARVIKTPRYVDARHGTDKTVPLAISADDLADGSPGGMSQDFRLGDEVLLTEEALERLSGSGWVEAI